MRRIRARILATVLATLFILNIGVVFNVSAVPANSIWIEPTSETLTSVGQKFNVTVWANVTDPGVYTWQVVVYFPSSWIKCNKVGYAGTPPPDPNDQPKSEMFAGLGTVPVDPVYGVDNVLFGESLKGAVPNAVGCKRLMWAEFEVTAAPEKYQTLTGALDTNNADTYLLDDPPHEIPGVSKGKCDLSYTWAPPPPAALGVLPELIVFDKYTNVTELEYGAPDGFHNPFDLEVKLKHLAYDWHVTGVSFCLCFNSTILAVEPGTGPLDLNITAKPGWAIVSVNYVPGEPDKLYISANWVGPPGAPSGDNVPIVDIVFRVIIKQGTVPPLPFNYYDWSPIYFCEYEVWDTIAPIALTEPQDGEVYVYALQTLGPPTLAVDPPVKTLGPEPSICEEFEVDVIVKDLEFAWKVIGIQWYILYDDTKIDFVGAVEGEFLQRPEYSPYGTWWLDPIEEPATSGNPPYAPPATMHILFADMLLPNGTTGEFPGEETGIWPNGTGVVATLKFHLLYQSYGEPDYTTLLHIEPVYDGVGGISGIFVDHNLEIVPHTTEDGEVLVTTDLPGRMIDLYTQWPAPFGGQGLHEPSDMFWPQKIVYLYANVTYNYWPVQSKDVAFEIEGPFNQTTLEPLESYKIWAKLVARTDENGVAWVKFQLPWPSEDPESLFGKWKVTATVDICGTVVNDTLMFDYRYLVEWVEVSTDKYEYNHYEWIEITVNWKSKSQQERPILIAVNLFDELETPFGIAYIRGVIGGAKPCHYLYYTDTVSIHVVKWAFAGIAELFVNAFDKDPTEGGQAWAPGYVDLNPLCIQPY